MPQRRSLRTRPLAAFDGGESGNRRVDLLVAVREGREQALVLARRHVDPALEQAPKDLATKRVEMREIYGTKLVREITLK